MRVTDVEYIVQWAEENRSYEQKNKEQICFHMCALFGVNHINCGLMENYSVEYTVQKLRELCHRAGDYVIGVEPMPYSGLPNVERHGQSWKLPAVTTQSSFWTPGTGFAQDSRVTYPYSKAFLRTKS